MSYVLPASLVANGILLLLLLLLGLRYRALKNQNRLPKKKRLRNNAASTTLSNRSSALTQARGLLAQNKNEQAIELLQDELGKNPNQDDLRLFLMAIFIKTEQPSSFEAQYDIISEQANPTTIKKANELRSRFKVSPNEIPQEKLNEIRAEQTSPTPSTSSTETGADNLDPETELPVLSSQSAPAVNDSAVHSSDQEDDSTESESDDDFDIDFDLEPSLDQTLLDLENEMTQSALTSVSLTNLKITIDEPEETSEPISDIKAPKSKPESNDSFSLDETSEVPLLDTPVSTDSQSANLSLSNEPSPSDISDDDDISLDFDSSSSTEDSSDQAADSGEIEFDLEPELAPSADSPAEADATGSIEFDLSDNQNLSADKQPSTTNSDDQDFELEFDLGDTDSDSREITEAQALAAGTPATLNTVAEPTSPDEEADLGDSFDFGDALSDKAIDELDNDDSPDPGVIDLSMQFDAIEDASLNNTQSGMDTESEGLDFGFSLETEDNGSPEDSEQTAEPELKDDNDSISIDELEASENPLAAEPGSDITAFQPSITDLAVSESDAAMPETEFDFDFENSDTEEQDTDESATLITPAVDDTSSADPVAQSPKGSEEPDADFDEDWFAQIDDEFSDISSSESTHVNLKLAKEYIRLGEKTGAQNLLEDLLENGSEAEKNQAQKLIDSL